MPADPTPIDVQPLREGDPPADAVVVGLTAAGPTGAPPDAPLAVLERLREAGEARIERAAVAHAHDAEGTRWLLVGLGETGPRHDDDRRGAAAAGLRRLRDLRAREARVVLDAPGAAATVAEALVLAAHRPAKVRGAGAPADGADEPGPLRVRIAAPGGGPLDAAAAADVEAAVVVARAQNEARALQQLPSNVLTPRALALRARELAERTPGMSACVELGEAALLARGMGLFAAVGRGSAEPPALVVVRYAHPEATGPTLGLVGKAVTHDTGGYSLKTRAGMVGMRLDMSGGAAVLHAVAAIARLGLPVSVIGVLGATENLVGERAMKPDDVFVGANGTSVEINNTDAEGRLVLADALHHALELGAERLVDVATLTGGVSVALGTSHAGLLGRDEAWLALVGAAGEATGERVWRLPLEDEHRDLLKSSLADLANSGGRSAHAILGAAFLERFSGEVPWAHVDMAGLSSDLPRSYLGKGPSGWGVRLLVEIARRVGA
ncbi:M17 family metallopeptidase [Patulibacter brassicae]|uniref:Probable cytosol aminopeptidase n=1 Tax=Patulibacter brassicae TaxID=1705717 RepID=A0ABU4VHV2_9ACTN|nr:M17 family metallopeptidase [Patulibacter brassicae]MDX8151401.1 M17 family metallopeptidase [Patulibacter brassicae]